MFTNPVTASPFAAQPSALAQPAATSDSSSTDSNSATITSNDFLQLLVTEMQNQDPTASTDPNEYINQLVQVNSLEQLVSINQDLGGGSSSSTTGSGYAKGVVDGAAGIDPAQAGAATATPASTPAQARPVTATTGNLSTPPADPKASRIASALSAAGQTLAPGSGGGSFGQALASIRNRAQHASHKVTNPAH